MVKLDVIDLSGINGQLLALEEALVGAGQESDLPTIVKSEGRLLAWEISTQVGPKKQDDAGAAIFRDAKKIYAPGPEVVFEMSKRNGKGGDSGLTWLYAGPDFLVGAPIEFVQPGLSVSTMRKNFDKFKSEVPKNAWLKIGKRGKQSVMKWSRIIVKRDTFDKYVKSKKDRLGRLRATFAYAAAMLGQGRIPKWVSRHFDKVKSDGAAVYDPSKLNDPVSPSLVFGSVSPGVATNFTDVIEQSIDNRSAKLSAKIQDVIREYSKDWMSGRKITKKAKA